MVLLFAGMGLIFLGRDLGDPEPRAGWKKNKKKPLSYQRDMKTVRYEVKGTNSQLKNNLAK